MFLSCRLQLRLTQAANSDELLTTAILGFSQSASGMPSAHQWALRTDQRQEPRGKLLRNGRFTGPLSW